METKYAELTLKALEKPTKKPRTDEQKKAVVSRYKALEKKSLDKIKPFNFASPTQLMWALKDVWKYPVNNFSGDISTGADVLTKLKLEGRLGISALLDYREYNKLVTSYFPDYKARIFNERLQF